MTVFLSEQLGSLFGQNGCVAHLIAFGFQFGVNNGLHSCASQLASRTALKG